MWLAIAWLGGVWIALGLIVKVVHREGEKSRVAKFFFPDLKNQYPKGNNGDKSPSQTNH